MHVDIYPFYCCCASEVNQMAVESGRTSTVLGLGGSGGRWTVPMLASPVNMWFLFSFLFFLSCLLPLLSASDCCEGEIEGTEEV